MSYKDVARQFGAGYVLLEPWDGVRWDVPTTERSSSRPQCALTRAWSEYSPKTESSSFGSVRVALDRRSSFK